MKALFVVMLLSLTAVLATPRKVIRLGRINADIYSIDNVQFAINNFAPANLHPSLSIEDNLELTSEMLETNGVNIRRAYISVDFDYDSLSTDSETIQTKNYPVNGLLYDQTNKAIGYINVEEDIKAACAVFDKKQIKKLTKREDKIVSKKISDKRKARKLKAQFKYEESIAHWMDEVDCSIEVTPEQDYSNNGTTQYGVSNYHVINLVIK